MRVRQRVRQVEDLTGKTYGNLTVIKRVDDYVSPKGAHSKKYLCQCTCGNQIEVQAGNLKSGNTVACSHSCPCKEKKYKPRHRDDLSGRIFGSLTVEKRIDDYVTPKGVHSSKYLCKCECGNQIEVIGSHLTSGHTKSCPRCILKKQAIIGQRFGKLVVKEYIETSKTTYIEKICKSKKNPNGIAVTYSYDAGNWYVCQCDCGNITYVKRGQLINCKTKSCGCLRMERDDFPRVVVKEYSDGVQRDIYHAEYFDDYGISPYWYIVCSCPTYERAIEGLKQFQKNNPHITKFRIVKLSYSSAELPIHEELKTVLEGV